jgi:hypothetical protein
MVFACLNPHFPISSLLPHMESIFTVLFSDQPGSPAAIYGHKWAKPCRTVFYALNSHARAALVVFSRGHDQAIVFLFRLECTLLSWECDRLSAAGRPKREHPDLQQTAHRCTSMGPAMGDCGFSAFHMAAPLATRMEIRGPGLRMQESGLEQNMGKFHRLAVIPGQNEQVQ